MKTHSLIGAIALGLVPSIATAQHDHHAGHGDSAAATPPAQEVNRPPEPAIPALTEPKTPIPVPTEADRAAAFPVLKGGHGHGTPLIALVNIDRLETWDDEGKAGLAWELNAWMGGDRQRLWVRSSGAREGGKTSGDVELLYGHARGAWWDIVGGVRQDFGPGKADQTWAALGIQGLAPYFFELSATAYVSTGGQTMVRAEAEYDLLLTNRLILQPAIEMSAYGKNDRARLQGVGPASIETGARLRYRLTRQIAPYLGLSHETALGNSADYRRLAGQDASETRVVIGINSWF